MLITSIGLFVLSFMAGGASAKIFRNLESKEEQNNVRALVKAICQSLDSFDEGWIWEEKVETKPKHFIYRIWSNKNLGVAFSLDFHSPQILGDYVHLNEHEVVLLVKSLDKYKTISFQDKRLKLLESNIGELS